MSVAPRFQKFLKNITVTNGGSGFQPGNSNVLTSGDQQYAIDYFGENYVLYFGQTTTTLVADLKVLIGAPTSTIPGDDLVRATATATLSSSGEVTAINITNIGDGYITAPTVQLLGTPSLLTNTSTTDILRDDGTYTGIATTSSDGIGTGLTVDIVVENGDIVKILPTGGEDYRIGEVLSVGAITIGGTGEEDDITFTVTKINGGSGFTATVELDQVGKENSYYPEKISTTVTNQIPEFVRDEYPLFATFIKKYYEYLESNTTSFGISPTNVINTIQDRLDVDFKDNLEETSTDFLDEFFEDYGKDFPVTMQADKNLLVKHITDFYTSKGTKKAIENLFKIMYNENIEVFVPNSLVLRPSDNNWSREYVVKVYENIFLPATGGTIYDPTEFEGKAVIISYFESTGSVTTRKERETVVKQVKKISYTVPQAYELTLELPDDFVIPSIGTGATYTPVLGGKIATINSLSGADASRTTGTYVIDTTEYTTNGNGTGAEFNVVVDNTGQATVSITTVGDNYAPGETITIPDTRLGNGGGAALTFNIATITDGKIFSITIDSAGEQYSANHPLIVTADTSDTITQVAEPLVRVTDGKATSVVFVDDKNGVGYNHIPQLRESLYFQAAYISLPTDDRTDANSKRAIPNRILHKVAVKSTTGEANGGFAVGQSFQVDENATLSPYALDYFGEDYTLTGIANRAFVKVAQVGTDNFPTALDVIAIGVGFQSSTFDFNIVSPLGYTTTLTCTTGYNAVYPGIFEDTRGFLSDANKVQDSRLYQAFSYQIRSERPKSEWGEFVKRAAHPSGMVAFSDLQIKNAIDFNTVTSVDTDLFFYVVMPDIEEVLVSETVAKDMHLPSEADTYATSEPYYSMEPGLNKVDITDFTELLAKDIETVYTDEVNPFHGSLVFDVEAVLIDNSIVDDNAPLFVIESVLADTYDADDLTALETSKPLSDSYQFEDTDSEYAVDYFANDNGNYTAGVPLVVLHFDKHFDQLTFGAYATNYFAEDYTDETSEANSNNAGDRVHYSDVPSVEWQSGIIADTFNVQDSAVVTLIIVRAVNDSLTTADNVELLNIGLGPTEIVSTADPINVMNVTTTYTDTYSSQDVLTGKDVGMLPTESIETSENVLKFPSINKTDTSNANESGSVIKTDFVDSTDYFLEDYVASEVRSIA
jgi:hypothetical protein